MTDSPKGDGRKYGGIGKRIKSKYSEYYSTIIDSELFIDESSTGSNPVTSSLKNKN